MEDWSSKVHDKVSESKQQIIAANCFMDGNADKFFKSLNSDAAKQSSQSLGLPNLQIDTALNLKPAEKGSQAYADWQDRAKERSNAALDPNCKNETKVEKGDSLWGIAERSMKEKGGDFSKKDVLAEMNKIIAANKEQYPWIEKNPNFLKEGMQLKLPEAQASKPEAARGRSSSNAAEELSNLAKSSEKGSTERKGRASATSVEEMNALSRNSGKESDAQSRGKASSKSVEERSNLSRTERNGGMNYNLSNFRNRDHSTGNTITSETPDSMRILNFDGERNSITTGNTRAKSTRI